PRAGGATRAPRPPPIISSGAFQLVTWHLGIHFLGPGVNAAPQIAGVAKAVPGKVGGRVNAAGPGVIVKTQQAFLSLLAHQPLDEVLGHELRAIQTHGVPLLARAEVEQADLLAEGTALGDLFGLNLQLSVRLVAGLDVGDDFVHVQLSITLATLGERFLRRAATTRATADVTLATTRPARA